MASCPSRRASSAPSARTRDTTPPTPPCGWTRRSGPPRRRHACCGDALAAILEQHEHSVSREYYFNDAGNQIRLLGGSVQAGARGEEVPEGGYEGDYVAGVAAAIPDAATAPVDEVAR